MLFNLPTESGIWQNTSLDQNQTCSGIKIKKNSLRHGKVQAQDPAQQQE